MMNFTDVANWMDGIARDMQEMNGDEENARTLAKAAYLLRSLAPENVRTDSGKPGAGDRA